MQQPAKNTKQRAKPGNNRDKHDEQFRLKVGQ